MTLCIALGCGALVGMCLGALGGGGSILIAPALLLGLHLDPLQATFVSKAVVGVTSLVAAALYWRNRAFDVRTAVAMAVAGLAPAYFGSRLAPYLPGSAIVVGLAITMFAAASCAVWRALDQRGNGAANGPDAAHNGGNRLDWGTLLLAGTGIGFLTGLLGIGCGFLIVPTLLFVGLPMRAAAGTSLVVICVNSAVAFAAGGDSAVPVELTLFFIAAAVIACPAGVHLASRISPPRLEGAFAALVAVAGLVMVWHAVAILA